MKKEQYQALHDALLRHPKIKKLVLVCTRALPGVVYISYPLMLGYLLLTGAPGLLRAVLVPAAGFLTVTVLRAKCNAPRPYEAMGIPAIAPKDTVGKSFPSRHAACAAVIAVTALHELPPLGAALLAVSVLIALSRVLSGVHFLRDVVCGLLLGGVMGWLGMYMF